MAKARRGEREEVGDARKGERWMRHLREKSEDGWRDDEKRGSTDNTTRQLSEELKHRR